jgi:tRNA modification GTPase
MDVDTIVSLATPAGLGAIAVVRLSGPDATRVLRALMPIGARLPEARRVSLRELYDPDDRSLIDRVVVTRFEAPRSFTGEDVVELSCHGGWLVPGMVVDACMRAGARQAEPGEFTRRAYLRGKLDLVQAEGIADLIEARSRALHAAALGQLERGLSRRVSELRSGLVRVEALLAHHVDFPEEDDAPVPIEEIVAVAEGFLASVDAMLVTAPEGELLREGALAVLAGRPNAGKSSLYNALIGWERAIVTDEPGTTRDALEASVQIGGFPFRLVDTAGLREAEGSIERLGIEIARGYLERANLILFCVPANESMTEADAAFLFVDRSVPVIVVETKTDLCSPASEDAVGRPACDPSDGLHAGLLRVPVSVESGAGLGGLRDAMAQAVFSAVAASGPDIPVLTRRRQSAALRLARTEVGAFRSGLLDGLPAEVAATHIRAAETALEELVGTIGVDDVLDVVFRDFCVGK